MEQRISVKALLRLIPHASVLKQVGPDFSCATTEMWCGDDSGDGLVVGQCCPKKCKAECENKNKKKNEEGRKKAERERKEKRKSNEESRKKAERERKKKKKQDEW